MSPETLYALGSGLSLSPVSVWLHTDWGHMAQEVSREYRLRAYAQGKAKGTAATISGSSDELHGTTEMEHIDTTKETSILCINKGTMSLYMN